MNRINKEDWVFKNLIFLLTLLIEALSFWTNLLISGPVTQWYWVGCTRSSLIVIAAEKGVAVGNLILSDNGDMQSDAVFLLSWKNAACIKLAVITVTYSITDFLVSYAFRCLPWCTVAPTPWKSWWIDVLYLFLTQWWVLFYCFLVCKVSQSFKVSSVLFLWAWSLRTYCPYTVHIDVLE